MKRIILGSHNKIVALLLMMLTKGYAFAQTSLGDPTTSEDKNTPPGHVLLQMSGLVLVLILIFYAGYRYWRSKNVLNKQAPRNQ